MGRFAAEAAGWLKYDPRAGTIKSKPWWLILQCDRDWFHLYKQWLQEHGPLRCARVIDPARVNEDGQSLDLAPRLAIIRGETIPPAWGPHISVIRGERPTQPDAWRRHKGRIVKFRYDPHLRFNGEYWWLDVFCPELLDIREEMGLRREPKMKLHLTVARVPGSPG